ncbi:MAG: M24 family metallopeptidase [Actinomycetota bacterium]|nr:M24 family metallopeptidase [Actinomycetota bacterium]
MPPSTSTGSSADAASKRALALEHARAGGFDALVAATPPTVRWLLCGRGRPISASEPESPYRVVLLSDRSLVLVPDIELARVEDEERFEELGFEVRAFPWHEGSQPTLDEVLAGGNAGSDVQLEAALAPERRTLSEEERERFRRAGADAADAMTRALETVDASDTELEVAARLAAEARGRDFFPPVVLVAGEERQKVYRHPLPTRARLGRHALLAITAEREGLHVSLTRIVSFGPPPDDLARLVRLCAEVDAVMLRASRPGTVLRDVLAAAARAYAERGFPEEWRYHHQGGLTGYRGREAFATPGSAVAVPPSAAVAWNPSITGGGKSEDTALVSDGGIEVITRTPSLPELDVDGLPRPGIAQL